MIPICSRCSVAIMEPHYMLKWWKKCPVCGFCECNVAWYNNSKKEIIEKDKMLKTESFLKIDFKTSED
jgi:hypothetical protein